VREAPNSTTPGDRVELLLDLRPQRQARIDRIPDDEQPHPPRKYGDWQGDPIASAEVCRIVLTPPTVDGSPHFRVEALTRNEVRKTTVRQLAEAGTAPEVPDDSPENPPKEPGAGAIEALQTADVQSAITPTGYRIEVSIPWSSLDIAAGRAIQSFGFDLILQDSDGAMPPCSRLVLFGADPPDPSLFGLITHNSRYRKGLVRVIAP